MIVLPEKAKKIKGIIFDLGHTLMHLDSTWPEVAKQGAIDLAAFLEAQDLGLDGQAFARVLLDLRDEGFSEAKETMREVPAERTMRRAYARFGMPDPDLTLVRDSIDAFFAYEDSRWKADPAAISVLSDLAGEGMRLGMFSNASDDRFIQRSVDRLGFRSWLNPALSSAGTGIRKPDPAALAPILSAWALLPEEVVVVGDTLEADTLVAQRAGMRSVWIPAREDARQEEGGLAETSEQQAILPDAALCCLEELPGCLDRL